MRARTRKESAATACDMDVQRTDRRETLPYSNPVTGVGESEEETDQIRSFLLLLTGKRDTPGGGYNRVAKTEYSICADKERKNRGKDNSRSAKQFPY